jgi:ankyrin repeat protein
MGNDLALDLIIEYERLFKDYDKFQEYPCSNGYYSKGFNKLMYLLVTYPNYTDIIENYIIEHPEQINEQNEKGWTPLMIVAKKSRWYDLRILKALIENGAKLNIKNNDRKTALLFALLSNFTSNLATIKILLEAEGYNSKILIKLSSFDVTNQPAILLLRHGVNINRQDSCGFTALMIHCIHTSPILIIIKTLLINGANQYIKNINNAAALDYLIPEDGDITVLDNDEKIRSLVLFRTYHPEL